MRGALRKLWAFVVRDFRQESSYRLHFISQWTGIEELDKLDGKHALVVQRSQEGSLDLVTLDLP